jgi:hypothetical protein
MEQAAAVATIAGITAVARAARARSAVARPAPAAIATVAAMTTAEQTMAAVAAIAGATAPAAATPTTATVAAVAAQGRGFGAACERHHENYTVHSVYLLQTRKRGTISTRCENISNAQTHRAKDRFFMAGRLPSPWAGESEQATHEVGKGQTGIVLRVKRKSVTLLHPVSLTNLLATLELRLNNSV